MSFCFGLITFSAESGLSFNAGDGEREDGGELLFRFGEGERECDEALGEPRGGVWRPLLGLSKRLFAGGERGLLLERLKDRDLLLEGDRERRAGALRPLGLSLRGLRDRLLRLLNRGLGDRLRGERDRERAGLRGGVRSRLLLRTGDLSFGRPFFAFSVKFFSSSFE